MYMPKIKHGLMSLGARGSIGNTLTYQENPGLSVVRKKPIPSQPRTTLQTYRRDLYAHFCQWWSLISAADKEQYETDARPYHITGFNLYMRRCLSLLDNLVLYSPLDENTGSIATDFSKNRNHGTIIGASWDTGYINSGLDLDGTDDYVSYPSTPQNAGLAAFTIALCIKTSTTVSYANMLSKYLHATKREFNLMVGQTGAEVNKPRCTICDETNNTALETWSVSDVNLRDNVWHVVIWTWDGQPTSDGVTLMVDGTLKPLENHDSGVFVQIDDTGESIRLGRQGNLHARDFDGLQDEFFLWNVALPVSQLDLLSTILAQVH